MTMQLNLSLATLADGGDSLHNIEVCRYGSDTISISQTREFDGDTVYPEILLHPIQAAWLAAKLTALVGG